jgi:murein L,D-transpeptidase YafK
VHAFPFRMTKDNMVRHARSEWLPFWRNLKEGYDHFELTRQVPEIAI